MKRGQSLEGKECQGDFDTYEYQNDAQETIDNVLVFEKGLLNFLLRKKSGNDAKPY